jgi:hypothetical protein
LNNILYDLFVDDDKNVPIYVSDLSLLDIDPFETELLTNVKYS